MGGFVGKSRDGDLNLTCSIRCVFLGLLGVNASATARVISIRRGEALDEYRVQYLLCWWRGLEWG